MMIFVAVFAVVALILAILTVKFGRWPFGKD